MKYILITMIGVLLFFAGCSEKYGAADMAYIQGIEKQRAEKDSSFQADSHSPIPPEERNPFSGLKYYPVKPEYRFTGPIVKYDSAQIDTILGTKGDVRLAKKYGYFEFAIERNNYRLQIYKILRDEPAYQKYLFLGFTDLTSGSETYGAGRYIDLTENDANEYVVDFNLAFSPYCAYNPKYTCAIPPSENYLPIRMEVGEKMYKQH